MHELFVEFQRRLGFGRQEGFVGNIAVPETP